VVFLDHGILKSFVGIGELKGADLRVIKQLFGI